MLSRVHEALEREERVLLCGRGVLVKRHSIFKFIGFVLALILGPPIWIWLLCQATIHQTAYAPIMGLCSAAAVPIACAFGFHAIWESLPNQRPFYALTSERLFRIRLDYQIETLASRSAVKRVESANNTVRLIAEGQPSDRIEVLVTHIRGLPEIIGGHVMRIKSR